MKLLSIGGGNYVNADRLVCAVTPESAPIKRLITDAREKFMLIDATCGKRTKSVFITDTGHIILSFKTPERFAEGAEIEEN
ncbi:MAG: DUF370 domain-containing protein [Ruminococcus sp.]|jgi:regulator of extracellular matrix RemA (YlzA/DUF370 family)|nr:DUF370 domain-containing protein [Ruminococcus sp.]